MVQITSPATADQYMITIDSRVKAGKSKIGTDNKGIVCMGNLENDYKEMAKAFNELSEVLKRIVIIKRKLIILLRKQIIVLI